jgi:3D (Asp-Asp-Asp) domain-containing protein
MLLALLFSMLSCTPREMRVTFYTLAEGTESRLTKTGHHPLAFRTAAVGDRRLLGRWLYVEDLGGWIYASDTGRRCSSENAGPCLTENTIDIFIGGEDMQPHAIRLGVQHWTVTVCGAPNL